jgi:hypothetical protein
MVLAQRRRQTRGLASAIDAHRSRRAHKEVELLDERVGEVRRQRAGRDRRARRTEYFSLVPPAGERLPIIGRSRQILEKRFLIIANHLAPPRCRSGSTFPYASSNGRKTAPDSRFLQAEDGVARRRCPHLTTTQIASSPFSL